MKPFDFAITSELPDRNVFVIEADKSDMELVYLLVGCFCGADYIGDGVRGENPVKLWCHVVPQYSYKEVLEYLKAVQELPYPMSNTQKEHQRRISIVSDPTNDSPVPREWLYDSEVNKAYKDAMDKKAQNVDKPRID